MDNTNVGLLAWLTKAKMPINTEKILKGSKKEAKIEKDKIADLLKTNPEALEAFEEAYRKEVMTWDTSFDDMPNAKQAADQMDHEMSEDVDNLVDRIVQELIAQTYVYKFNGSLIYEIFPPSKYP